MHVCIVNLKFKYKGARVLSKHKDKGVSIVRYGVYNV